MKDPVLEPEDAGGVGGAADHSAGHAGLPRDAWRRGAQMGAQVFIHMQAMLYRTEEHSTKGLALIFNKKEHLSTKPSTSTKTK